MPTELQPPITRILEKTNFLREKSLRFSLPLGKLKRRPGVFPSTGGIAL
jgi:hypothetical protein